jgi:hypothetical protein
MPAIKRTKKPAQEIVPVASREKEVLEIGEELPPTNVRAPFEERFKKRLSDYRKFYRVEDLNDANDRTILEAMVRYELILETAHHNLAQVLEQAAEKGNLIEKSMDIKKLSDMARNAMEQVIVSQRTLDIDRKSRRDEENTSIVDYIKSLKAMAAGFVEERMIKVFCPYCKVMTGRIAPVHKHTAFLCAFQCSQCGKMTRARRDEKDVFFDVKDAEWRKPHPVQIVHPKRTSLSKFAPDDLTIQAASIQLEDEVVQAETLPIEDQITVTPYDTENTLPYTGATIPLEGHRTDAKAREGSGQYDSLGRLNSEILGFPTEGFTEGLIEEESHGT